jgi:uncharacterized membrane protein YkoI
MNVRRTATTAAAAALTLLVLGGTAYALGTDGAPTVTAVPAASVTGTEVAVGTPTSSPTPTDDRIPVDRAREIAVAAVGGGEVTKIESEVEHGRLQWKVDVTGGGVAHDVRIDAATGDVVGQGSSTTAPTSSPAPRAEDRPGHDVGDDKGGDRARSDDGAGHDAGDDHGGDRARTGDDGRHGGDDSDHSGRH